METFCYFTMEDDLQIFYHHQPAEPANGIPEHTVVDDIKYFGHSLPLEIINEILIDRGDEINEWCLAEYRASVAEANLLDYTGKSMDALFGAIKTTQGGAA